jgi:hypothetical protein
MRQRKAFGLSEIRKDQLLHYFTAVWQLRKRCWKPWLTTLFPHQSGVVFKTAFGRFCRFGGAYNGRLFQSPPAQDLSRSTFALNSFKPAII